MFQIGSIIDNSYRLNRELGRGGFGVVYAAEWEIPLEAQGAEDPPVWTWGTRGPIYPGQSPFYEQASK